MLKVAKISINVGEKPKVVKTSQNQPKVVKVVKKPKIITIYAVVELTENN